jgi:hypothetical protein
LTPEFSKEGFEVLRRFPEFTNVPFELENPQSEFCNPKSDILAGDLLTVAAHNILNLWQSLSVKPTINFLSTNTDPQLITNVDAIISALTGNPDYPNPSPTLTVASAALKVFEVAVSEASLGGVLLTLTKNAKRAALVSLASSQTMSRRRAIAI